MNTESFVQEMFKAVRSIRYVAIIDSSNYRIIASKQREGIPSYAPDETVNNFMSLVPEIILEAVEKMGAFLGPLSGVTAHYQKALLIFYRFNNLLVALSFQPNVETPFYDRITEAFKKGSAQYLK
jgi:hypothetical protein